MIHPDLVRLRLGLGLSPDPKALYRYRVDALRLGQRLYPVPGDLVRCEAGDGRVVAVEEAVAGPLTTTLQLDEGELVELPSTAVRIAAPHRPAMLLGEDELHKRAEEDADQPEARRALETLEELARREEKEGVNLALRILGELQGPPSDELRRALKSLLRSRATAEVEVALRKLDLEGGPLARVELPALLASATDEQIASDTLDRLEDQEPADAVHVVEVAGRWLVGAGGPAFANPDLRERVSAMAREHGDKAVRVALFVQAARALQSDDLLEAALQSDNEDVQAAAANELLRRGRTAPVWSYLEGEKRPSVLLDLLGAADRTEAVPPLELLRKWLSLAGKRQDASSVQLRQAVFFRLPELTDRAGALETLEPWLSGEREDHLHEAIWAAGLLGGEDLGERILALAHKSESLPLQALALEAMIRLGYEQAGPALDAWGVPILKDGPWGEEVVDVCGLALGRRLDPNELIQRFAIDPPQGAVRRARLLDVALALHARGDESPALRICRDLLPVRWTRYRELVQATQG